MSVCVTITKVFKILSNIMKNGTYAYCFFNRKMWLHVQLLHTKIDCFYVVVMIWKLSSKAVADTVFCVKKLLKIGDVRTVCEKRENVIL